MPLSGGADGVAEVVEMVSRVPGEPMPLGEEEEPAHPVGVGIVLDDGVNRDIPERIDFEGTIARVIVIIIMRHLITPALNMPWLWPTALVAKALHRADREIEEGSRGLFVDQAVPKAGVDLGLFKNNSAGATWCVFK